jgi:hypothetical protein
MDIPCQLIVHPPSSQDHKILINLYEDVSLKVISEILMKHYLVESKSVSFNIDYTSETKFKGESTQSISYADYTIQEDDEIFEAIRKESLSSGDWVEYSETKISDIPLDYNDIFDCSGYIGSDFVKYNAFFLPDNTVNHDSMDETHIYSCE